MYVYNRVSQSGPSGPLGDNDIHSGATSSKGDRGNEFENYTKYSWVVDKKQKKKVVFLFEILKLILDIQ